MKIAVVGAGISGLTAAYLLAPHHEVTVFEAEPRIGGHTHTVDVPGTTGNWAVDTGFIVFNQKTYPNFVRLLQELQVDWQNSNMSFGVKCEKTGLEFSPSSAEGLYGSIKNISRIALWRLPAEIVRFRRLSETLIVDSPDFSLTLADFLRQHKFSAFFKRYFLIPMGAAIWSADPQAFARVPAAFFARFFSNHGFLELEQPQWLALRGGSRSYLEPLTRRIKDRIRLQTPVKSIVRHDKNITLTTENTCETFDQVILACHSDQCLKVLSDPTPAENEVLSSIPYQENEVVLHSDADILPARRAAWASWNYLLPTDRNRRVALTYYMNRLQNLAAPEHFCVTLNAGERIKSNRIIRTFSYAHPVFTPEGVANQKKWHDINGVRRTWYAGAWWRYGFHEDGMISGLRVARALGVEWP